MTFQLNAVAELNRHMLTNLLIISNCYLSFNHSGMVVRWNRTVRSFRSRSLSAGRSTTKDNKVHVLNLGALRMAPSIAVVLPCWLQVYPQMFPANNGENGVSALLDVVLPTLTDCLNHSLIQSINQPLQSRLIPSKWTYNFVTRTFIKKMRWEKDVSKIRNHR